MLASRMKLVIVLLVIVVVLSGTGAMFLTAEAHGRPRITMTTNPAPFPSVVLGVTFDFDVIVRNHIDSKVHVFLTISAECPDGGTAAVSGDASGDACDETIETLPKAIKADRSKTWEFTVVYSGSIGSYEWTINAFKEHQEDED